MTPGLPSIAIVTPSFNQAKFLEETICSVVRQDYPCLHYCVMDGGSTDESKAIILRYASKIDFWRSEPDRGQSDAIASGFEQSDSEIMGWLNSDDFFLPGALLTVGDYFLKHPEVEAVSCGCLSVDAKSNLLTGRFCYSTRGVASTFDRFRYLESQDGVFQPAVFWRRSAFDEVGGLDRSLRFTMDLDLFTRLAKRRPFGRLPQYVSCFRIHDESKSSRIQSIRTEELEGYRKRFETIHETFLYRSVRYLQYRIPSLIRKIGLRVNNLVTPLPRVEWEGASSANDS